jgi:hypothetical protein
MEFVVNKVVLVYDFVTVIRTSPVDIIPSILLTTFNHSFIVSLQTYEKEMTA